MLTGQERLQSCLELIVIRLLSFDHVSCCPIHLRVDWLTRAILLESLQLSLLNPEGDNEKNKGETLAWRTANRGRQGLVRIVIVI